jgi:hypothetical protein
MLFSAAPYFLFRNSRLWVSVDRVSHKYASSKRHRRKLLSAAEAWLFLAERLDQSDHVAVASEVGALRSLETKRCRPLARGINDTLATQRLPALAHDYTAEAG